MECSHIITQTRKDQLGSWCVDCGKKIFEVESRECRSCKNFKDFFSGAICTKKLMGVSPKMKVTFKIEHGSCWEPTEAE